jgi:hypothetical protein
VILIIRKGLGANNKPCLQAGQIYQDKVRMVAIAIFLGNGINFQSISAYL